MMEIECKSIPHRPAAVYSGSGWSGWNSFLGKDETEYRSLQEAQAYVRQNNIRSVDQWKQHRIDNPEVAKQYPHRCDSYYVDDGWKSWHDFFGTVNKKNVQWWDFHTARRYFHNLKLKSTRDVQSHITKDVLIPKGPRDVVATYESHPDWKGLGDFYGTSFEDRAVQRFREIMSRWSKGEQTKDDSRWVTYRAGVRGRDDKKGIWLQEFQEIAEEYGVPYFWDNKKPREIRPFAEARVFVRGLGLRSWDEWNSACKSGVVPTDIIRCPYKYPEYVDIYDWLGYEKSSHRKQWMSFESACELAKEMGITSISQWRNAKKSNHLPMDAPCKPEDIFGDRWTNFMANRYVRPTPKIKEKAPHIPRWAKWVPIAEELARQNNGMLPPPSQLESGLHHAFYRHPEGFAHIEQVKTTRLSLNEWVDFAQQLAEDNGGILPSPVRIQEKHKALDAMMRRFPDKFSHLQQDYCDRKSPNEWVVVAEELTKANGGILPTQRELKERKLFGLMSCLWSNKPLFSHIKRNKFNTKKAAMECAT